MKIGIVEIGTADFWTEAGKKDGLFIEPLKDRFDNLPDCRKENIAISNYEGYIDIYYIPKKTMIKFNIPFRMGGCSSVNKPHPSVIKHGYEKYITKQKVKVDRIKNILKKYEITDIDFLKVDTEGHDCIILNDFFDTVSILPQKIQFEANILTKKEIINNMISRLESLNYNCKIEGEDCYCNLINK